MENTDKLKKVTINLPASLIDKTLSHNDKNLTEAIREALKAYNHARACNALKRLRGKVKFSLSYDQIKEDRE